MTVFSRRPTKLWLWLTTALCPPPPAPPPPPPNTHSGRLDRKIEFPHPNEEARAKILQIHSRKMNVNPDVNYDELARSTDDFNAAQLKAVRTTTPPTPEGSSIVLARGRALCCVGPRDRQWQQRRRRLFEAAQGRTRDQPRPGVHRDLLDDLRVMC